MSQHEHSPHHPLPHRHAAPDGPGPYWRRAHHDWRFWVGVVLMVGAMVVYVTSENLAFRPRIQQPVPGAVGR